MLNRYITFYKPAIQFIVFCAILSMCILIGGHLFSIFNQVLTGMTLEDINKLTEIPSNIAGQIKISNALGLIVSLLLPACVFAYLAYPEPAKYLGFTKEVKKHHWLWAITLLLIAFPFAGLLEEWNKLIPSIGTAKELDDQYNHLAESMLMVNNFNGFLSNILFLCITPALIEEVLFRGCLQRILVRWMQKTPYIAIFIVAILFSAFHGQMSAFFPRLFLGLLLGLSYYFSGSIWISILMHFVNNFISVVLAYLYTVKAIPFNIAELPDMNLFFGLASAASVILFIYFFYKDRKPYQEIEVEKEEIIV